MCPDTQTQNRHGFYLHHKTPAICNLTTRESCIVSLPSTGDVRFEYTGEIRFEVTCRTTLGIVVAVWSIGTWHDALDLSTGRKEEDNDHNPWTWVTLLSIHLVFVCVFFWSVSPILDCITYCFSWERGGPKSTDIERGPKALFFRGFYSAIATAFSHTLKHIPSLGVFQTWISVPLRREGKTDSFGNLSINYYFLWERERQIERVRREREVR